MMMDLTWYTLQKVKELLIILETETEVEVESGCKS